MLNLTIDKINQFSLMSPDAANKLAVTLNKDSDGEEYRAVHDPKKTGLSFVAIFENGEEVARV